MKRKHLYSIGRLLILCISLFLVIAFGRSGSFTFIENRIYDLFFQLRDTLFKPSLKDSPVVIVGIDRKTLNAYKEPVIFWDSAFTESIDCVSSAKPAAIGFDILHLTSSESKSHDFSKMKIGSKLLSTKSMILPYSIDDNDISIPVYVAKRYRDAFGFSDSMNMQQKLMLLAIAERTSNAAFGYSNLYDDDGVIRNALLYDHTAKPFIDSFSLRIYLAYLRAVSASVEQKNGLYFADGNPIHDQIVINYAGPPGTIPMIPLIDCIKNKNNAEFLKNNFAGKVVLFGAYDRSLDDIHNTPYISSSTGISRGMYGVEIIAHTVDTLARQRLIVKAGFVITVLLTILISLLGISLARLPSSRSLIILFSAEILFMSILFFLFVSFHIFVSVLPAFALGSIFFFGYLYEHYLLGKDRLLLHTILKSYLDPRIVEKVVNERGVSILKGQRKIITVLFADIRNFTTLSESMKHPEDVVSLLNIYLPEMSSIIYDSEGCVDKFIGDGIMAFWNAPNDVDDHAEKAVQCAQKMILKLGEINRIARSRNLIKQDLVIGIGVHTGSAVIGNIGSDIKHDYTAIGDTVNTASRLEGKTKDIGSPILISSSVNRLIDRKIIKTHPVGSVDIKGKTKKVSVFSVELKIYS
jgi:adenylate cyclase